MAGLPLDASDLTPEWLSEVLGADVSKVEIVHHAFATNQRAVIALEYADGPSVERPASLFVKLAPVDPAHRAMIGAIGMGQREAEFYAEVAPRVDLRIPKAWYSASEGDAFVILLEDLAAIGCRFSNGEWGISADAAARALEELAVFHATPAWQTEPPPSRSEGTAALMRMVLDEHGDEVSAGYRAIGELYVEHHARIDELWHRGPQTFIHGDTHIGNVFLDGDRVGFHDWGLCRTSTPMRDVSYFLTMSVDPDERRANERDLLRTYVDALAAAGGPAITEDEAWQQHRIQASYTVVASFLSFMPSYAGAGEESRTLGSALTSRAEQAIDDLDVVEAIKRILR